MPPADKLAGLLFLILITVGSIVGILVLCFTLVAFLGVYDIAAVLFCYIVQGIVDIPIAAPFQQDQNTGEHEDFHRYLVFQTGLLWSAGTLISAALRYDVNRVVMFGCMTSAIGTIHRLFLACSCLVHILYDPGLMLDVMFHVK